MPSRSSGDPYGTTDKLDEALLQVMALRLEARGQPPKFKKMLDDYLETMDIDAAKSVLDMGSGTGVADFWRSGFESFRMLMPKVGAMTDQEAEAWAEALRQDSERGVFFGSSNYYSYVARRRA